jgi:hypothetical protein
LFLFSKDVLEEDADDFAAVDPYFITQNMYAVSEG